MLEEKKSFEEKSLQLLFISYEVEGNVRPRREFPF